MVAVPNGRHLQFKKKKLNREFNLYLTVMYFIVFVTALKLLFPAYLIVALCLPFLVSFVILKVAFPLLFVVAL